MSHQHNLQKHDNFKHAVHCVNKCVTFTKMVRKKIDNRIRVLIENGAKLGHRTLFVIVGDKGRDQVSSVLKTIAFNTIKPKCSINKTLKNFKTRCLEIVLFMKKK